MKETNIDCRKHRKSTHLASADIDAITSEGKLPIFTIKEVFYETGVDVSGTKKDGYFAYFEEPIKPLLLNTTNKKIIAGFAKENGFENEQAWNIGNWKGIKVEFFVDRKVKLMGNIVDGIRIRPLQPKAETKPQFTEANFDKAKNANATIEMIKKAYSITPEMEQKYLNYGK